MRTTTWLGVALLVNACSAPSTEASGPAVEPSDATSPTTAGSGGTSGDPQNASGGTAGASGGAAQPPDAEMDAAGVQVETGPVMAMPDARSDAVSRAKNFACTQVIGVVLTSEWYLAGFENGVDKTRWQLKWAEHSYVDEWAKPDSPFWATPVVSPCADGSTTPDRIVFVSLSWTLMAEKDWETALSSVVDNIKTKYPSARTIDLMSIIRGPSNKACDPNPNAAESTKIPAGLDDAIAQVALANPGLVSAGPKIEATACSDFNGVGPHLTSAGNIKMAALYAAHYAKLP